MHKVEVAYNLVAIILINHKFIKDCIFRVIIVEDQNKDFMLNYPIMVLLHNYL